MVDGPKLEARVFVAFGAVIVGDVTVGDDAYIGANAVVTASVPAGVKVGPLVHWDAAV